MYRKTFRVYREFPVSGRGADANQRTTLQPRDCRRGGVTLRWRRKPRSAPVIKQAGLIASLLACCLAAPVALADDPIKDIIDHEVPALKDGTRIAVPDVEKAILDACARRKFTASVVSPGEISARWENRGHWFD